MSQAARRRRERRQQARAASLNQVPGTPRYTGPERPDTPVRARIIDYNADHHAIEDIQAASEIEDYLGPDTVSWINVDGLHDEAQIVAICERFGVHPLWVEDLLNLASRPKAEVTEDQVLVITRAVRLLDTGELDTEQVSLILTPSCVISFQERPGDVWDGVRRRIETGAGRVRRMGADYLLHAMLDAVVDHYFLILEHLEKGVDAAEDQAVKAPSNALPLRFLDLKQELAGFRQTVWPTREALAALLRAENSPISAGTAPYYRDLYDHIVQVMDITDATRERLVGVVDLNVALQGQRLNEIMKVLTLVSTVFIPLSFLAGLYGMNFEWMPELKWPWAYPTLLSIMVVVGLSMGLWFRSRRWV